ncbi:MAG: filamentous hemagglutinin N-terminal domain-containing protein [Phenylobacterium sp.]|uniref:beta strand repeat-containing protein n=1 Tax=Phenylobacterium sp. TaxID=1871053 RepID=UPI0025D31284|nr:filamentous hemagglutinin N-terminal domain-containing protein [Phenylobacterium sp.]MBI1200475.1 filamentous hemagglutinin N-terminal domain-containing protein [Phenylobacterium sp.]
MASRRRSALAALLAAAAWPAAVLAQTAITPDAGPLGLGTEVARSGTIYTIDGGTLAGGNLFHSFTQFGLGSGATAEWVQSAGDAAAVSNVINRVTGGEVSEISGTIDSTALPNASFYFINPAGVVFGADAQVNVPAAAYFSTAGELRFADGASFAVATPGGSTLSVAPPESFGFLGGQGNIAIDGAILGPLAEAGSLSFSAADIRVTDGAVLARGVDFAAFGPGSGTLALNDPLAGPLSGSLDIENAQIVTQSLTTTAPMRLGGGTVNLDASLLVTDARLGADGGDMAIAGGLVTLTHATQLSSIARDLGRGGDIRITAGDLASSGDVYVIASTRTAARGGDIIVEGGSIEAQDLTLATTGSDTGSSGGVSLTAASSLVGDGLFLLASNLGVGGAGSVAIDAPDIELDGSFAFGSVETGTSGDIAIRGDRVFVSGGAYGSSPGTGSASSGDLSIVGDESLDIDGAILSATGFDDGVAGSISLTSPQLTIRGNTDITVEVFGGGTAGSILIDGGSILIDSSELHADTDAISETQIGQIRIEATGDLDVNLSLISSDTFDGAPGGAISLSGANVTLVDSTVSSQSYLLGDAGRISVDATGALEVHNTSVSSTTGGAGDAGQVSLSAQSILLEDRFTAISSDTFGSGRGGDVTIRAGSLDLENEAAIGARAGAGAGDGGTVDIQVTGHMRVADFAYISADTVFGTGDAGAVNIKAGDLTVDGEGFRFSTFISSDTYGRGDAGGVNIEADSVNVINAGAISSNALSSGSGNGGTIAIKTGTLTVRNGGVVSSQADGAGRAGNVTVTADAVTIDGALNTGQSTGINSASSASGDAGTISIDTRTLNVAGYGFIASDAGGSGAGGDVFIRAGAIRLDNADISSSATSFGDGGNVSVEAEAITLDNEAVIGSDAFGASEGDAGVVEIRTGSLTIRGGSRVSTATAGLGDAGTLNIVAQGDVRVDGGFILSAAVPGASGGSGDLDLTAGAVTVANGGQISTTSNNPNAAGEIAIAAGAVQVDGMGSIISSENLAGDPAAGTGDIGGDAGTISIAARDMRITNGGRVSTNSTAGAAGNIDVSIPRPGLFVLEGAEQPGIIQTSSGTDTGGKITIADPLAVISNGGLIQALGQTSGANVQITSRYFINSTDRVNRVDVNGEVQIETGLYDVASGVTVRDLSVLDASKVLRGQCPAARSTGVVSQLVTRPVGPYVSPPPPAAPRADRPGVGGCP